MYGQKKNRAGFTLIELIVAVSMMAMVAIAVTSALYCGLNVYERVAIHAGSKADLFIGLEEFERDIRNTFRIAGIGFSGHASRVSFAGLTEDGHIGRISYYLDTEKRFFARSEMDYAEAISAISVGNRIKAIGKAEGIALSYLVFDKDTGRYEWRSECEEEAGPPEKVRIEITFIEGNKAVKLRRTVKVPLSG